jgi:hypothetical protein
VIASCGKVTHVDPVINYQLRVIYVHDVHMYMMYVMRAYVYFSFVRGKNPGKIITQPAQNTLN